MVLLWVLANMNFSPRQAYFRGILLQNMATLISLEWAATEYTIERII